MYALLEEDKLGRIASLDLAEPRLVKVYMRARLAFAAAKLIVGTSQDLSSAPPASSKKRKLEEAEKGAESAAVKLYQFAKRTVPVYGSSVKQFIKYKKITDEQADKFLGELHSANGVHPESQAEFERFWQNNKGK